MPFKVIKIIFNYFRTIQYPTGLENLLAFFKWNQKFVTCFWRFTYSAWTSGLWAKHHRQSKSDSITNALQFLNSHGFVDKLDMKGTSLSFKYMLIEGDNVFFTELFVSVLRIRFFSLWIDAWGGSGLRCFSCKLVFRWTVKCPLPHLKLFSAFNYYSVLSRARACVCVFCHSSVCVLVVGPTCRNTLL